MCTRACERKHSVQTADVLAAVEKIVMTEGARDEAAAREYMKRLQP